MDKMAGFLFNRRLDLLNPCIRLLGWAARYLFSARKRHNFWSKHPPMRCLPPAPDPPLPSPLSDLPEELLLHIMGDVDGSSLLCLRRTSRQFMRLFGDRTFTDYHEEGAGDWPMEKIDALKSQKALRTFRGAIGRDRLCYDCLAARTGPDSKIKRYQQWSETPLHCATCEVDHPSCAFSSAQRGRPDFRRICIAREGRANLWRERSLGWDAIEEKVLNEVAPRRCGTSLYTFATREGTGEIRFAYYGGSYRIVFAKGPNWRDCIGDFEWDWDHDDDVPWWERDFCAERDYTWLSRENYADRRVPLVPESFWYRQVDPDSFGLTSDHEAFGVTWCLSKSCPNYYHCYSLRRGRRVYIPCEEGCKRSRLNAEDTTRFLKPGLDNTNFSI